MSFESKRSSPESQEPKNADEETLETESPFPPTNENIEEVAKNFSQTVRFADRMPDVKKLQDDVKRWASGEDLDSPLIEENYPGWTQEDFQAVVEQSGI